MVLPVPLALPALVGPALHAAHGVRRRRLIHPSDGAQPCTEGESRQQRENATTAVSGCERRCKTIEQAGVHTFSLSRGGLVPHVCDTDVLT
jgi:hypothetical protein